MSQHETIRLGLIGMNISRSQAPRLHQLAGQLCGLNVSYDLFELQEATTHSLVKTLEQLSKEGLRGVNVTHPFKENVTSLVTLTDSAARVGAVNTVALETNSAYNTDYSGFVAAYRNRFGNTKPGTVLMLGAGGVARAVAFALIELGVSSLKLVDPDSSKAASLARDLRAAGLQTSAHTPAQLADLVAVDGLVNCTPLGMSQYPGSALPPHLISGQRWAFDAVYTPVDTVFLQAAKAAGLELLSGYELFFYQGVNAFKIFTGQQVDEAALRRALAK